MPHHKHPICGTRRRKTRLIFYAFVILLIVLSTIYLLPDPSRHAKAAPGNNDTSKGQSNLRPIIFSNHSSVSSNFFHSKWRQLAVSYPPGSLMQLTSEIREPLPPIQFSFPQPQHISDKQKQRRAAVKTVFDRCWESYKEKAWLKDELLPISGKSNDHFGGWGATLIDNLDTLWILDLKEEFKTAVNAALRINFIDPSRMHGDSISVFETTIRFLGGFLSAYNLTGCQDKRLLEKAIHLGDTLYVAFDTPNRMPLKSWSPKKAFGGIEQVAGADDNILADMASLTMEFTRLSQLTGDMRYFDAVQRVTNVLERQQFNTKLPGMWPLRYNSANADFTLGDSFSLGGEADSTYEYLLKMYLLLGNGTSWAAQYKRMYQSAVETAMQMVLFRPMTPDNLVIILSGKRIIDNNASTLLTEIEHLSCFLGGMVGRAARYLKTRHMSPLQKSSHMVAFGHTR